MTNLLNLNLRRNYPSKNAYPCDVLRTRAELDLLPVDGISAFLFESLFKFEVIPSPYKMFCPLFATKFLEIGQQVFAINFFSSFLLLKAFKVCVAGVITRVPLLASLKFHT